MIRYELKSPSDLHWGALWKKIMSEEGVHDFPYDVNGYLRKYKGRTYNDPLYGHFEIIKGIEFDSEQDLIVFKLTFN